MGGNAFEALVGAVYLDRGYNACMRFMQKRILGKMIDIDTMAKQEVNFKSKLIEWSQKNRVKLEFVMLDQQKDKSGNPIFTYQVVIEGEEGCSAKGYSKKESQQMASKLTLEKLRTRPQYIDAVFAAKTNRTKMEEEPVTTVPDPEEMKKVDLVTSHSSETHVKKEVTEKAEKKESRVVTNVKTSILNDDVALDEDDEFDLSDITAMEKTKEDIIAAAEAAAFEEQQ